ncbi:MAG TPA: OmpH family outer membrane protein [Chitinophagaceae bacterium]|nr:OmpH family outer membrane protein [Chitinophagaceae bacterium]
MKKVLSIFTLSILFFSGEKVYAQQPQLKIGVFDLDLMVQAMPGYKIVDSLVQVYNTDSLGAEYEIYQNEFHRLDSTFKADSAARKSAAILNFTSNQRRQVGMNLLYWQQIGQQKSDNKRGMLAQPLFLAVANAYKKVLAARKYTLILKPNTYELGSPVENVFPFVAKELNVQLPAELGGGIPVSENKPVAKPPVKKK